MLQTARPIPDPAPVTTAMHGSDEGEDEGELADWDENNRPIHRRWIPAIDFCPIDTLCILVLCVWIAFCFFLSTTE
jgi:hypothetical protein